MRVLLLLPLLAACGSAPPTPTQGTPTGSTGSVPTTSTSTTTPRGSNIGSLVLRQRRSVRGGVPTVELAGVFPKSDPGYVNLAHCARLGGPCLPQVPDTEDDYLDFDPDRTFDFDQFDYSYVGLTVGLGPLAAAFENTLEGLPHYYANYTDEYGLEGFDGTYGVRLDGEWGEYEGYDDITIAPQMNLMSHEAGVNMPFHDGQTIVLEWEPQGTGDVFLSIVGGGLARMYLLEDDGYFELDVDSLGLGTEEEDISFSLARWETRELDIHGNLLDVISINEVTWPGNYFYVGGRDLLVAVDTCGDADTMPETVSGQYWGRLADWGYKDNLNPSYGGCTSYSTSGEEGFVRFDLPPLTFLSIAYTLLTDDASLYLLEDCTNADSCLIGSDVTQYGGEEAVSYFNNTDSEQVIYAALDGWRDTTGLFYADISVTTLGPPDMYDSCSAVQAQPTPTTAGGYYSTVTAYTNQLDPATGACIPVSSPGPDAMTRIDLLNGETLTVNVDMPGSNPALYLLYNCTSTNSCAAGSDVDVGSTETVQYTNNSGATETLYLVLDSKVAINPYFMTIDIQ